MHFLVTASPLVEPSKVLAPLGHLQDEMNSSRRQSNSGHVDLSCLRVPTKRQNVASVTDFVQRRAKESRGNRPPTNHYSGGSRPPRALKAQGAPAAGSGAIYQDSSAGAGNDPTSPPHDLPPPSVQLPMGLLHSGVAGMASFMEKGGCGDGRNVSAGAPTGASGAEEQIVHSLCPPHPRHGGPSPAAAGIDGPQGIIRGPRRNGTRLGRGGEGRGEMPLDASLAATLFPPAAPTATTLGTPSEAGGGGRSGHTRASIFGRT